MESTIYVSCKDWSQIRRSIRCPTRRSSEASHVSRFHRLIVGIMQEEDFIISHRHLYEVVKSLDRHVEGCVEVVRTSYPSLPALHMAELKKYIQKTFIPGFSWRWMAVYRCREPRDHCQRKGKRRKIREVQQPGRHFQGGFLGSEDLF